MKRFRLFLFFALMTAALFGAHLSADEMHLSMIPAGPAVDLTVETLTQPRGAPIEEIAVETLATEIGGSAIYFDILYALNNTAGIIGCGATIDALAGINTSRADLDYMVQSEFVYPPLLFGSESVYRSATTQVIQSLDLVTTTAYIRDQTGFAVCLSNSDDIINIMIIQNIAGSERIWRTVKYPSSYLLL